VDKNKTRHICRDQNHILAIIKFCIRAIFKKLTHTFFLKGKSTNRREYLKIRDVKMGQPALSINYLKRGREGRAN